MIRKAEETFVSLGKHFLSNQANEGGIMIAGLSHLVMHPGYNASGESFDGDLAMAVLSRSIMFTDFIKPICIWTKTSGYNDILDQQGSVAGK